MKAMVYSFACLAIFSATVFAEDVNQQVLQQIEALQRQIAEQQRQIELMKEQMTSKDVTANEALRAELLQELDVAIEARALAQEKDRGPLLTLGRGIDGLRLTGDLRLRYEHRDRRLPGYLEGWDGLGTQDQKNERFRTRFRLGAIWTNSDESWEVGAGLATGETNHSSGASSATSTNDSWGQGGAFESGAIYLDFAYAKHKLGDFTPTFGQHKNPYLTSGIMVDSDIRPTGATLQYANSGFFGTVGAYNVRYSGTNQTLAYMYGAQLGYGFKTDNLNGKLAIGYYHYDDQVTEVYSGNLTAQPFTPATVSAKNAYNWHIGDVYGELGGKVGEVGVKGFAQVSKNFGADDQFSQASTNLPVGYSSGGEDMAWIAGLGLSYQGFKASYAYAHVEGDSLPFFIKDADFGSGVSSTNIKGHILKASYNISKNFSLGGTALLYDLIKSDAAGGDRKGNLYQLDLSYKF